MLAKPRACSRGMESLSELMFRKKSQVKATRSLQDMLRVETWHKHRSVAKHGHFVLAVSWLGLLREASRCHHQRRLRVSECSYGLEFELPLEDEAARRFSLGLQSCVPITLKRTQSHWKAFALMVILQLHFYPIEPWLRHAQSF